MSGFEKNLAEVQEQLAGMIAVDDGDTFRPDPLERSYSRNAVGRALVRGKRATRTIRWDD